MIAKTAGRRSGSKGKTVGRRPQKKKTARGGRAGQHRSPAGRKRSGPSGQKGSPRARPSRKTRRGATIPKERFSLPKGRDVGAAVVLVGERTGNQADQVIGACEIALGMPTGRSGRGVKRPLGRGKTTRRARPLSTELCQTVAAASHEVRARILRKLLEGPAIYRSLREITKLKPGPLYHHINQLRLAGLIMPKRRDLYELTRGGRNLILALMAMAPLIRDARRRPQPMEESERGR